MNINELEKSLYIYGTNPLSWPKDLRGKAANFIANSEEARNLIKTHENFELKIAAGRLHGMGEEKTDSMIQKAISTPQEKPSGNIVKFGKKSDKKSIYYAISSAAILLLMLGIFINAPQKNQEVTNVDQEIDMFLQDLDELQQSDELLSLLES